MYSKAGLSTKHGKNAAFLDLMKTSDYLKQQRTPSKDMVAAATQRALDVVNMRDQFMQALMEHLRVWMKQRRRSSESTDDEGLLGIVVQRDIKFANTKTAKNHERYKFHLASVCIASLRLEPEKDIPPS